MATVKGYKIKYINTLEEYQRIRESETITENYFVVVNEDDEEQSQKAYNVKDAYNFKQEVKKEDKENGIGGYFKYYIELKTYTQDNVYLLLGDVKKYKNRYTFKPIK